MKSVGFKFVALMLLAALVQGALASEGAFYYSHPAHYKRGNISISMDYDFPSVQITFERRMRIPARRDGDPESGRLIIAPQGFSDRSISCMVLNSFKHALMTRPWFEATLTRGPYSAEWGRYLPKVGVGWSIMCSRVSRDASDDMSISEINDAMKGYFSLSVRPGSI